MSAHLPSPVCLPECQGLSSGAEQCSCSGLSGGSGEKLVSSPHWTLFKPLSVLHVRHMRLSEQTVLLSLASPLSCVVSRAALVSITQLVDGSGTQTATPTLLPQILTVGNLCQQMIWFSLPYLAFCVCEFSYFDRVHTDEIRFL